MTIAAQNLSDRELLLLVLQKVDDIGRRMDRVDERLGQGDRRFSDHDLRLDRAERDILTTRGDMARAITPAAKIADAAAAKADRLDGRMERIEEALIIDGQDGKPVPLREVFIRQQRTNERLMQLIGLVAASAPVLAVVADRVGRLVWP